MRVQRLLVVALTVVCALVLLAGPATAKRPATFTVPLTGEAEVPGPGDPDGSGTAVLRVNSGRICYTLMVEDIEPATAAHIHEGQPDEAGPIVQALSPPTDGSSSGCIVNPQLAREILAEPGDYYVNVHNKEYPAGALRGQL